MRSAGFEDHECGVTDRVGEQCFGFRIGGGFMRGFARSVERLFVSRFTRAENIEADVGGDSSKPTGEVLDVVRVGAAEAKPGFLNGIVGFIEGAKQTVSDSAQAPSILLELFCEPVAVCHPSHSPDFIRHDFDERRACDVTGGSKFHL
jgi:hypothetical protein